MTIQELGSIGELIGAIATVATLVYLALQIRQNSFLQRQNVRALELSALDQSYRYGADFRALILQDEALGELWLRGCVVAPIVTASRRTCSCGSDSLQRVCSWATRLYG